MLKTVHQDENYHSTRQENFEILPQKEILFSPIIDEDICSQSSSTGTVNQIMNSHLNGQENPGSLKQIVNQEESINEIISIWPEIVSDAKEIKFFKKQLRQLNQPLIENCPLGTSSANSRINERLSTWWPIKRNQLSELLHCWLGYLSKKSLI